MNELIATPRGWLRLVRHEGEVVARFTAEAQMLLTVRDAIEHLPRHDTLALAEHVSIAGETLEVRYRVVAGARALGARDEVSRAIRIVAKVAAAVAAVGDTSDAPLGPFAPVLFSYDARCSTFGRDHYTGHYTAAPGEL